MEVVMRRVVTAFSLVLLVACMAFSQIGKLARTHTYPLLAAGASLQDSVLNGLSSIRGCAVGNDIDKDGKKEIAVTNYAKNGVVDVFEALGNDSLKLVWQSPLPLATGSGILPTPSTATPGGGSTPRVVLFGDLDNDGLGEIIYQLSNVGIVIFEWDGVTGSDNYGTTPSFIINLPLTASGGGLGGNIEDLKIADVDGDGQNELLVAYNNSTNANDGYFIVSIAGDYATNSPGFASANTEFQAFRSNMTRWSGGGSPVTMIPANFDGTGRKEILLHLWNFKNVLPIVCTAANTYQLSDTATSNGRQNFKLGRTFDDVALFGGFAYDVDKDGRDEVYLPTYPATGSPYAGTVHMIYYSPGDTLTYIDSVKNVFTLSTSSSTGTSALFGFGYGDIDRNGKPDIYISSSKFGAQVVSLEYQGGGKTNLANWKTNLIYAGDTTWAKYLITDSAGVRVNDTTKTTNSSLNGEFVSKMFAAATDIDGDNYEDIIMPMQAINDSIIVIKRTWNATASKYDTTQNIKIGNTKRWGLRVLEGTVNTGVEEKNWTVIMPDDYRLEQNYPNPFNPSTTIAFYLPIKDRISIRIYDALGREIRTLLNNEERQKGKGSVVWDGKSGGGVPVASGTYFYTMTYGNFSKSSKMLLLK